MKKILTTKVLEIVDSSTGEVTRQEVQKIIKEKVDSENFYMVFLDYMAPLFKLNSDAARKVLDRFCQMAEFNSGRVLLPGPSRKELCDSLEMSANQLTNCIKKLKDCKLITGNGGEYKINPAIFWKGDQSARRQEILDNAELHVTYEIIPNQNE